MNTLKSVFVSLYLAAAVAVTVFAVRSLVNSQDYLAWGGVILVTAPFLLVISWIMIVRNVARTSAHFPSLIGLGILGIALSCWGYVQGGSLIAPILALAGLLAFLIYAYWYSSFNRRSSAQLLVGKTLPAFELTDIAGHSISSASLTDKPAVWILFGATGARCVCRRSRRWRVNTSNCRSSASVSR